MPDYLLDTHVLLWYFSDAPQLSDSSRNVLTAGDSVLYISVASWWEIGIKVSIGKLQLEVPLSELMRDAEYRGFRPLPIQPPHLLQVAQLPFPANGHRDPFDRLLIAQAQVENMVLLSQDTKFDGYAVQRLF